VAWLRAGVRLRGCCTARMWGPAHDAVAARFLASPEAQAMIAYVGRPPPLPPGDAPAAAPGGAPPPAPPPPPAASPSSSPAPSATPVKATPAAPTG